jgi:hypothetical protein
MNILCRSPDFSILIPSSISSVSNMRCNSFGLQIERSNALLYYILIGKKSNTRGFMHIYSYKNGQDHND